jgi:hypothetical protein
MKRFNEHKRLEEKIRGFNPQAKYYERETAACQRN